MNPEISKSLNRVNSRSEPAAPPGLDSREVKARLLAILLPLALALACSADEPTRKPAPIRIDPMVDANFPPKGPIELRPTAPPAEGTLFQLQLKYEGRSEALNEASSTATPETLDELMQLELDYRQVPVASPDEDSLASSLVLDALRRRMRASPPGAEISLEIGDDRIRAQADDKIDVDLRGAQPKGDLTPRAVLNRPFALLVSDLRGGPKSVTLRGIPSAKRLLASLPIRESIGWVQVEFPDGPVLAGESWTAKRFLPNAIGRLGVGIEIEYRLVGFERVDGVPCARVSLRAKKDTENAPSEFGFTFEQLRYEVSGDAWISLANSEVQMLRVEDIAAVSYRRTTGTTPARFRARYEGRASLERLAVETTSSLAWADGTKRFAEVNTTRRK